MYYAYAYANSVIYILDSWTINLKYTSNRQIKMSTNKSKLAINSVELHIASREISSEVRESQESLCCNSTDHAYPTSPFNLLHMNILELALNNHNAYNHTALVIK